MSKADPSSAAVRAKSVKSVRLTEEPQIIESSSSSDSEDSEDATGSVMIVITEPVTRQKEQISRRPSMRKISSTEDDGAAGMNLSFCGCGFLGLYHLGVAKTLVQKGRPLFEKVDRFCGASAGSLIAALLATKGPDEHVLQQSIDFCYNLAADVRKVRFKSLNPKVSLLDPLEEFLHQTLPPDAHERATGRLFVSVTRRRKNSIVSKFNSRDELIKYLLASSYIPRITGKEPIYIHDRRFLDGGMTNNLPIPTDGRTVTISPFAGRQDICPPDASRQSVHMNLAKQRFRVNIKNMRRAYHAFLPPKKEKMDKYFNQGVKDAEAFLIREGYMEEGEGAEEEEEEEGGVATEE